MAAGGKKKGSSSLGGRGGRGGGGETKTGSQKNVGKEKKERKGKIENEVISVELEALREFKEIVNDDDDDEIFLRGGMEEKKEKKEKKRETRLPLGLLIGVFLPPGSRQRHSNIFTNETKNETKNNSNFFSSSSSSSSSPSSFSSFSSANQNNQEIHILHFAATPPLQWVEDVEVEDIREIFEKEEEEREGEEGKMKKKKKGKGEKEELGRGGGGRRDHHMTVELYLEYLQKHSGYSFSQCAAALVDWMSSHFRQIQRQLPGGLRVVGVWGILKKDEEEDLKRVEEDEEEDGDSLEFMEEEEDFAFMSPCTSSNQLHHLLNLLPLIDQISSSSSSLFSSSSSFLSHFRFLAMSISSSSSSNFFDEMSVYSYDSLIDIPSSFSSPSVSSFFKEVMMCKFSFPSNCWNRGFCRLPVEVILCVILPTSREIEEKVRERRFGKDEEEMEGNKYYLTDTHIIYLSTILSKLLIDKYFSFPILFKFSSSVSGEEEEENEEEEEEGEKRKIPNRSIVVGLSEMNRMMIYLKEEGKEEEGLDEKENTNLMMMSKKSLWEHGIVEVIPLEHHLSPIILTIVKENDDDDVEDKGDKRKRGGGGDEEQDGFQEGWKIIIEPSIFSLRNGGGKGKKNNENENEMNFCFQISLNSLVGVSYFLNNFLLKEVVNDLIVDVSSSLSFRIIEGINNYFEKKSFPSSFSDCFSVRDHFVISSSSSLSFCEYHLVNENADVSREALRTLMGLKEGSLLAAVPSLCDSFSFSMRSGGDDEAKSSLKGEGRDVVEQTRRKNLPNRKMSKKEAERHRYWKSVGLKLAEMGGDVGVNTRMNEIKSKKNCEKQNTNLWKITQIIAAIGVVGVGIIMMSEKGNEILNFFL